MISDLHPSPILKEYKIISKLKVGQTIIKINPHFFRPTEVERLVGDSTKANNEIGWKAKITIDEMIDEMIRYDIVEESKNKVLVDKGYNSFNSLEDVL